MESKSKRRAGVYKKDFFYRDVKVLSVHIDEPFTDPVCRKAGVRRIERFYLSIFARFRRYCETGLYQEAKKSYANSPEGAFECYFAALSMRVTLKTDDLLSLCYDRTEIRGLHDRSFLRYADTWHLPSGRIAELKEFLPGQKKKETVQQIVKKLQTRQSSGERFYPQFKKYARTCFSPRRFYLTEDDLVIFYQPMTLQNMPDTVCEIVMR